MEFRIDALPPLVALTAIAVVILAAISDLIRARIPNWITVPGVVLGLGLHAYYGGLAGAASSAAGMALGFGFFMVLHLAGGMGAGDVKLAGAVGALVGARMFIAVFIATGLLGGVAAIVLSLARGRLRQTLAGTGALLANLGHFRWGAVQQSSSLDSPGALRLPYGAVIAGGTIAAIAIFH